MRARDNPYRVECLHQLTFRFRNGANWESLLKDLQRLDYRAAIVGPHGTGKTTLMLELQRRLEEQGERTTYLRLLAEDSTSRKAKVREWLAKSSEANVLLLDSAGLLNPFQWWNFCRRTKRFRGVVVTAHHRGRLPTLIETAGRFELLRDLVHALNPDPPADSVLQTLDRAHHGNIRDCLRELYDQWS